MRRAFLSALLSIGWLVNASHGQTQLVDGVQEELVELRRASKHPMRYYLSVPRGFVTAQDARRWPVLVCVVGADSVFLDRLKNYRDSRGDLPFIVVTPCTFSNTNSIEGLHRELYRRLYTEDEMRIAESNRLDWDKAGLLAVLADLRNEFNAEERIYLTGFSGGGILTYHILISHPGRLNGVVAVCANYFGDDNDSIQALPLNAGEAAMPVRLLIGELDPMRETMLPGLPWMLASVFGIGMGISYIVWRRTLRRWWVGIVAIMTGLILGLLMLKSDGGIDPQSRAAMRRLRERGYRDVNATIVPGMGHEPATERVVAIFATGLAR